MSDKKVGVFGIYASRLAVENATDSLVTAGFPPSDISVLMPQTSGGSKDMGTEKATKAPEGTAAGVTAGGVIGGTLGVLAGCWPHGDPRAWAHSLPQVRSLLDWRGWAPEES